MSKTKKLFSRIRRAFGKKKELPTDLMMPCCGSVDNQTVLLTRLLFDLSDSGCYQLALARCEGCGDHLCRYLRGDPPAFRFIQVPVFKEHSS